MHISERMPKHFRQCNLCSNNTWNKPELVFFTANKESVRALHLKAEIKYFFCEEHFLDSDIKIHGHTKRLVEGSVPVNISLRGTVSQEPCYGSVPADLEDQVDLEDSEDVDEDHGLSTGGVGYQENECDDITDSPLLPSSGSVYLPSQISAVSGDSENLGSWKLC